MTDDKPEAKAKAPDNLFDVPEDIPGSGRYSVYDRDLGRYVGGVHSDKPTAAQAKAIGGDHAAVVAV